MNTLSNVTVIIPCYNDGAYIRQAIDSIVNQTVKVDKIIVVDDGSEEATKKVLKALDIENLEVIYQNNQGVSCARNNAIKSAATDYILCLDADDYFEATFVEKATTILNNHIGVSVVGSFYRFFGNTELKNENIKPLGGDVTNFLFKNNGLGTSMFRKKCWEEVGGYDEKMLKGYEDWEFWMAILKKGWSMHIINEVLFNYRKKLISRDQTAENEYDYEIKKYIFLKHKEVYLKNFETYTLQLLESNALLKQKNKQLKSSRNYKLGTLVMNPFRVFKVIKNKLQR